MAFKLSGAAQASLLIGVLGGLVLVGFAIHDIENELNDKGLGPVSIHQQAAFPDSGVYGSKKAALEQAPKVPAHYENCVTVKDPSNGYADSCEESRPYRGRTLHCVTTEGAHYSWAPSCDYTRFYAENPDLAAADLAAGKARTTSK